MQQELNHRTDTQFTERLTFSSDQARDMWAREEHSKGYEVRFMYLASSGGRDLYAIDRRVSK